MVVTLFGLIAVQIAVIAWMACRIDYWKMLHACQNDISERALNTNRELMENQRRLIATNEQLIKTNEHLMPVEYRT